MDIFGLSRHGLTTAFEQFAVLGVLLVALLSLLYAWLLRGSVLKKDKGTAKMQEVWDAIRVGANGYLRSQLKTILPAMAILTVALFLSVITRETQPGSPTRVRTPWRAGSNMDYCRWPHSCFPDGRIFLSISRSIGNADGNSSQRAFRLGC